MHSLPVFLRLTGRPVILTGAGEAADAKRRLLERAGAQIVGEEDSAARIAIVSDGDAATAQRLRARGVLVNATDNPDLCDFTLPAIVDRDPVLIAIGTGGASAGLAKALRQRLEAMLPARLGKLADGLLAARGAIRAPVSYTHLDVYKRQATEAGGDAARAVGKSGGWLAGRARGAQGALGRCRRAAAGHRRGPCAGWDDRSATGRRGGCTWRVAGGRGAGGGSAVGIHPSIVGRSG
ncbi:bifunctional precorrin-2 dehydrogenase/sirohydrochlorin ferrochelatase [Sphingobium sp. B2]|uniref:precorrin-2 dehydrogenase/sirohydrochlorin ferrochelatase family protein n=1 Tax=Sphingobium sp. B2 TaxID=2583228 RepID=UPI0021BD85FD|nr:bifunctional precorrin-2 dehydrogenase/sirohydrochlorin ferrochelatase [Sphingobium sp. B2]